MPLEPDQLQQQIIVSEQDAVDDELDRILAEVFLGNELEIAEYVAAYFVNDEETMHRLDLVAEQRMIRYLDQLKEAQ